VRQGEPDALRRLGLAHLFILFISMLVIVAPIVIASLFTTTSARRAGFARAECYVNERGKAVGVTAARDAVARCGPWAMRCGL
jgi:hypothetical protein